MLFIDKITHYATALNSVEESILLKQDLATDSQLNAFLKKLKQYRERYWITCDCKQDALLVICLLNGNIYIRCKKIDHHDKNCHFVKNDVLVNKIRYSSPISMRIKTYDLYKNVVRISSNSKQLENSTVKLQSLSKLRQVLYTSLVDAELNKFNYHKQKILRSNMKCLLNLFKTQISKLEKIFN